MPQEQARAYDTTAESLSLQWATETGPTSYQDRLEGLQRDRQSFQNELANAYAYWSGSYELGTDSHGVAALVTPEIAIPGRVHRSDSHAMVDSMAGNAVYVLDQISKGNMPSDAWDTAREQLKQFKAVQSEILTLQEGESFLGYAMSGKTTRDGVALMHVTRHENTFVYETRLIGGISEGAAHDVLIKFTSDVAVHKKLKENTSNPIFEGVKGRIHIDLKNQQRTIDVVRDVLEARKENNITIIVEGACRTKAAPVESGEKKTETIDVFIRQKQHEYVFGPFHQTRLGEIRSPFMEPDKQIRLKDETILFDYSSVLFDRRTPQAMRALEIKKIPEKTAEAALPAKHEAELVVDVPKFDRLQMAQVENQNISIQKTDVVEEEKRVFENVRRERSAVETYVQMPIATVLVKSEGQTLPSYKEKALTITVPVYTQLGNQQRIEKDRVDGKHAAATPYQYVYAEEDHLSQPAVSEKTDMPYIENRKKAVDIFVAVSHVNIQDMQGFVEHFARQVQQGVVQGEVKKLVWMESTGASELMPVEEMKIDKDTTKTVHNLLHFLRKIVRVYAGDDVIRERGIQRIASDTTLDELEELETYLHVLQASRFQGHLFATVN